MFTVQDILRINPDAIAPEEQEQCKMLNEMLQKKQREDQGFDCGMFDVKVANAWTRKAINDPELHDLWKDLGLIYEHQCTCIFSDSGVGKTMLATQIGIDMAKSGHTVLYVDFELSYNEFANRYISEQGTFKFPDNFYRCELKQCLDQELADGQSYEDVALKSIGEAIMSTDAQVVFIDNITWINANTEKGFDASQLVFRLKRMMSELDVTVIMIAHTPKRTLNQPITQNDLGGSKRIANFVGSLIAMGRSVKDESLRYIKQVKRRYGGEIEYGADNVLVCTIEQRKDGFTGFKIIGQSTEAEQLQSPKDQEVNDNVRRVKELREEGMRYKDIADTTGLPMTTVYRYAKKG